MSSSSSELLISAIGTEIPLLKKEKIPSGFIETVDMMFSDGDILLDKERFNILLSYWHLPPAGRSFFNHYFNVTINSLEFLKQGLDKFIIDALWHFGDL